MVEKMHAKAKTIWLVGTKHANDKQYTPLDGIYYWSKKICTAKCKLRKGEMKSTRDSGSKFIPMKFIYAGDMPSTYN